MLFRRSGPGSGPGLSIFILYLIQLNAAGVVGDDGVGVQHSVVAAAPNGAECKDILHRGVHSRYQHNPTQPTRSGKV